jgi:hypothetical protein
MSPVEDPDESGRSLEGHVISQVARSSSQRM